MDNCRGGYFNPIYLDKFGEADENLVRGKDLFLNNALLNELYEYYVTHKLPYIAHTWESKNTHIISLWSNN